MVIEAWNENLIRNLQFHPKYLQQHLVNSKLWLKFTHMDVCIHTYLLSYICIHQVKLEPEMYFSQDYMSHN